MKIQKSYFLHNMDNNQLIELSPSRINTFCKMLSSKKSSDKQKDENTKDVGPGLSTQTNTNCRKKRRGIQRKYTAKVDESNADLKESDKQPRIVWVGSINDMEWICKFCNKVFSSPNNYVDHVCKVEKRYICLLCFAEFTRNSSLNRHLKQTHNGEKKHVCYLCDKSFSERIYLENHLRKHIGERPYLCDICKKSFHSKLGLKYHIKTHIGDFKYECDFCPKRFLDKTNMLAHLTTHTGEKNYKCDICGKRFGTMPALIHHKVVHSEEKIYTCQCGKSYKHKYSLKRHEGLGMCGYSQKLNEVEPDSNYIPDNSNILLISKIHNYSINNFK
ncbi:zinc finger protein 501-like [Nylanderia fulva]|uniref:zinc finger protein 501-like n=1 Tax=Nylanderia fulva TaxID=613905 RepID=UPI0010FB369C|nr:zinc finger protein 501-like [Nylanderia fulva]XP_029163439.1 zinc finger protein 501-like [Nylanderia fulva]XP_029163440.1 zinc finger protein 501-like [Nylanderia fulva]XP_029163441.1 zinc finger protein 501-like [Nylanderia fulva]XP_029163442.1 zinc finger protein 501-like [Nylanderia fulva]